MPIVRNVRHYGVHTTVVSAFVEYGTSIIKGICRISSRGASAFQMQLNTSTTGDCDGHVGGDGLCKGGMVTLEVTAATCSSLDQARCPVAFG